MYNVCLIWDPLSTGFTVNEFMGMVSRKYDANFSTHCTVAYEKVEDSNNLRYVT